MPSRPRPSPVRLTGLTCEHARDPAALDEPAPRFSWKLVDARSAAGQTAFHLVVTDATSGAVVMDPGRVRSAESVLVPYRGEPLQPHTRYTWRVRIWDQDGRESAWSETATFTMGFLGAAWPAEWIGLPVPPGEVFVPQPAITLRQRLEVDGASVVDARLYVTALGLVRPFLNGQRVGRDELAPGWTDYHQRVEYLAYDVTLRLRPGANVLGLVVGEGWYAGRFAWERKRHHYGATPAVRAALRLVRSDNSVSWIGTSSAWQATAAGPIRSAGLYDGEHYDARRELAGWCEPGRASRGGGGSRWQPAQRIEVPPVALNAKLVPPVRCVQELPTRHLTEPGRGTWVADLGQNMVGVVRLRVTAPRGTRVRLRFGEMLNPDGTLYTANLRSARATDTYVCRGGGEEVYEPAFTFHGFRYVELQGLPAAPTPASVTGLVWFSDLPETGSFRCSDAAVNQLQSNIRWGQRGNFLDVPTDCPQRDERMGWTGDAQVFCPTASFNYDCTAFFRKWLRDVRDAQHADGAVPDVVPDILGLAARQAGQTRPGGNAAWADAAVICPWVVYQQSGDARVLAENFGAMTRWVEYQRATSRDLVRPDTAYGDWLATDAVTPGRAPTPCDLIGTAYFAQTARLVAESARLLGRNREAREHATLHRRVVRAFRREFLAPSGRLAGDTQTGYLLALAFDLLPERLRATATDRLAQLIRQHGDRLATGFVGTPLLGPVLSRFGRTELAYKLLHQRAYPSWLYTVDNGATTMWERWNSWTKEHGFGEVGMNSFNHYAYGAVGEWLYTCVGGIQLAEPGYRRLHLQPRPGGGLTEAETSLETPYGRVESHWRLTGRRWRWQIVVPPNTSATAVLPTLDPAAVTSTPSASWTPTPAGVSTTLAAGRHRIIINDPALAR